MGQRQSVHDHSTPQSQDPRSSQVLQQRTSSMSASPAMRVLEVDNEEQVRYHREEPAHPFVPDQSLESEVEHYQVQDHQRSRRGSDDYLPRVPVLQGGSNMSSHASPRSALSTNSRLYNRLRHPHQSNPGILLSHSEIQNHSPHAQYILNPNYVGPPQIQKHTPRHSPTNQRCLSNYLDTQSSLAEPTEEGIRFEQGQSRPRRHLQAQQGGFFRAQSQQPGRPVFTNLSREQLYQEVDARPESRNRLCSTMTSLPDSQVSVRPEQRQDTQSVVRTRLARAQTVAPEPLRQTGSSLKRKADDSLWYNDSRGLPPKQLKTSRTGKTAAKAPSSGFTFANLSPHEDDDLYSEFYSDEEFLEHTSKRSAAYPQRHARPAVTRYGNSHNVHSKTANRRLSSTQISAQSPPNFQSNNFGSMGQSSKHIVRRPKKLATSIGTLGSLDARPMSNNYTRQTISPYDPNYPTGSHERTKPITGPNKSSLAFLVENGARKRQSPDIISISSEDSFTEISSPVEHPLPMEDRLVPPAKKSSTTSVPQQPRKRQKSIGTTIRATPKADKPVVKAAPEMMSPTYLRQMQAAERLTQRQLQSDQERERELFGDLVAGKENEKKSNEAEIAKAKAARQLQELQKRTEEEELRLIELQKKAAAEEQAQEDRRRKAAEEARKKLYRDNERKKAEAAAETALEERRALTAKKIATDRENAAAEAQAKEKAKQDADEKLKGIQVEKDRLAAIKQKQELAKIQAASLKSAKVQAQEKRVQEPEEEDSLFLPETNERPPSVPSTSLNPVKSSSVLSETGSAATVFAGSKSASQLLLSAFRADRQGALGKSAQDKSRARIAGRYGSKEQKQTPSEQPTKPMSTVSIPKSTALVALVALVAPQIPTRAPRKPQLNPKSKSNPRTPKPKTTSGFILDDFDDESDAEVPMVIEGASETHTAVSNTQIPSDHHDSSGTSSVSVHLTGSEQGPSLENDAPTVLTSNDNLGGSPNTAPSAAQEASQEPPAQTSLLEIMASVTKVVEETAPDLIADDAHDTIEALKPSQGRGLEQTQGTDSSKETQAIQETQKTQDTQLTQFTVGSQEIQTSQKTPRTPDDQIAIVVRATPISVFQVAPKIIDNQIAPVAQAASTSVSQMASNILDNQIAPVVREAIQTRVPPRIASILPSAPTPRAPTLSKPSTKLISDLERQEIDKKAANMTKAKKAARTEAQKLARRLKDSQKAMENHRQLLIKESEDNGTQLTEEELTTKLRVFMAKRDRKNARRNDLYMQKQRGTSPVSSGSMLQGLTPQTPTSTLQNTPRGDTDEEDETPASRARKAATAATQSKLSALREKRGTGFARAAQIKTMTDLAVESEDDDSSADDIPSPDRADDAESIASIESDDDLQAALAETRNRVEKVAPDESSSLEEDLEATLMDENNSPTRELLPASKPGTFFRYEVMRLDTKDSKKGEHAIVKSFYSLDKANNCAQGILESLREKHQNRNPSFTEDWDNDNFYCGTVCVDRERKDYVKTWTCRRHASSTDISAFDYANMSQRLPTRTWFLKIKTTSVEEGDLDEVMNTREPSKTTEKDKVVDDKQYSNVIDANYAALDYLLNFIKPKRPRLDHLEEWTNKWGTILRDSSNEHIEEGEPFAVEIQVDDLNLSWMKPITHIDMGLKLVLMKGPTN